jgi:general secretion pathway protein E
VGVFTPTFFSSINTDIMLIGQMLVDQGAIAKADLERAVAEQIAGSRSSRLGAILVRQGTVSESTLYETLAKQLALPLWRRAQQPEISTRAASTVAESYALPESLARRWEAFVSPAGKDLVWLVARDPLLPELLDYVARRSQGWAVQHMLAAGQDMTVALAEVYAKQSASSGVFGGKGLVDLRQLAQDAPIVEFVASMLAHGTDLGASDIHIEPTEQGFAVRFRVDGSLLHAEQHPQLKFDAVTSRLKLIAGLDIAERRLPQDGRFSTRAAGIDTEVRVSVIPGVHGESSVLRLLPKTEHRRFQLEALGLEQDHLALLRRWLTASDGIILVTGPTGSGKSTTLYAALAATDIASTRVLTVEDPVEYQLPGITQFQVQADIGFTFPAALRAILRHDPDTIMVGEIRDAETAAIAIQASLTGHKVLSTLHTNDAASAFVRLADIGVAPFLLAASVRGVIAQRLIRRLCKHCATEHQLGSLPDRLRLAANRQGLSAAHYQGRAAVGCEKCGATGYKGRVGVHEFLPTTDALRQQLSSGEFSPRNLRDFEPPGFRPLQEDALRKFWVGDTSLAEVLSLPTPESPHRALM